MMLKRKDRGWVVTMTMMEKRLVTPLTTSQRSPLKCVNHDIKLKEKMQKMWGKTVVPVWVCWPVRCSYEGVGRWGNGGRTEVGQFDLTQLSQKDVTSFHISEGGRRSKSETQSTTELSALLWRSRKSLCAIWKVGCVCNQGLHRLTCESYYGNVGKPVLARHHG